MAWRPSRFFVFIAILATLHFLLHVGLGLGREAPDLLIVAALIAARRMSAAGAVTLGFSLGLIEDTLAIAGFGVRAFALAAAAFLGARSQAVIDGSGALFMPVYLFVGAWAADVLVWFLRADAIPPELVLQSALSAVWAAAAGGFSWMMFRRVAGTTA
ncbi:MAG: rod shape-determining protein MreD [Gemmatimonadetes bacterium]|nr:rod shape-determining protein MreD [Gemmatimonadota bacterium]